MRYRCIGTCHGPCRLWQAECSNSETTTEAFGEAFMSTSGKSRSAVVCAALLLWPCAVALGGETPVTAEDALVRAIVEPLKALGVSLGPDGGIDIRDDTAQNRHPCTVEAFRELVTSDAFEERWPGPDGEEQTVGVTAEIWTAAIQAALDANGCAFIPGREAPYYLDAPIIMRSGYRLLLDTTAEMRLKPGSNCCMVHNEHLVSGQNSPVSVGPGSDTDILITGGIWTTLATTFAQSNGNVRARAPGVPDFNSHGVIVLSNVRRAVVRDVTIRQCKPHAIQLSNCEQWCVADIRFEDQRRDGVHINGPASNGVIHNIRCVRGAMGDDMVALNAWDWKNTSMSFGPIHHVLIDGVQGDSGDAPQTDQRAEIRFLAGTKHYPDGTTLACDIETVAVRTIRGIRTVKMYDQPNLELGRDNDFADPIGQLRNLHFRDIVLDRPTHPALFQIAMNADGVSIRGVALGFAPASDFKLVQVGPMSQTFTFGSDDPARWVELFSPDKDCTVRGLIIENVTAPSPSRPDPQSLVAVIQQTFNEDYPNSTPRGGTGKGILLP